MVTSNWIPRHLGVGVKHIIWHVWTVWGTRKHPRPNQINSSPHSPNVTGSVDPRWPRAHERRPRLDVPRSKSFASKGPGSLESLDIRPVLNVVWRNVQRKSWFEHVLSTKYGVFHGLSVNLLLNQVWKCCLVDRVHLDSSCSICAICHANDLLVSKVELLLCSCFSELYPIHSHAIPYPDWSSDRWEPQHSWNSPATSCCLQKLLGAS